MAHNEWSYDTAQPPIVYNAKVGGKTRRVVSVATMEGVWFCYDAAIGTADLPAREGDRPHGASAAPAGQAGRRLSRLDRRPQLLAGGLRPEDELHLQRCGGDGGGDDPEEADADAEEAQAPRRATSSSGSQNGDFGSYLPGWHDHGSISAIDVNTGRRVWKFQTPEPERGGVSITASGIGFAGGGDGNLRAFDLKTGQGAVEVPDRPADRRRARRSTRSTARSTSRSRSAARRRRRTAASCPG